MLMTALMRLCPQHLAYFHAVNKPLGEDLEDEQGVQRSQWKSGVSSFFSQSAIVLAPYLRKIRDNVYSHRPTIWNIVEKHPSLMMITAAMTDRGTNKHGSTTSSETRGQERLALRGYLETSFRSLCVQPRSRTRCGPPERPGPSHCGTQGLHQIQEGCPLLW